jgi:hypothetical protein
MITVNQHDGGRDEIKCFHFVHHPTNLCVHPRINQCTYSIAVINQCTHSIAVINQCTHSVAVINQCTHSIAVIDQCTHSVAVINQYIPVCPSSD